MESKGLLKFLKLDGLIEHLTGYAEDKMALFKIEAKEELSAIITKVVIILMVILLGAFTLLFASLAIGIYLNFLFNSSFIGFVIIAIFYLIFLVIGLMLKDHKSLHTFVRKNIEDIDSNDNN